MPLQTPVCTTCPTGQQFRSVSVRALLLRYLSIRVFCCFVSCHSRRKRRSFTGGTRDEEGKWQVQNRNNRARSNVFTYGVGHNVHGLRIRYGEADLRAPRMINSSVLLLCVLIAGVSSAGRQVQQRHREKVQKPFRSSSREVSKTRVLQRLLLGWR